MNRPASHSSTSKPLVVGLGEALFDCFPDREALGGAPINMAVHADALLRPLGGQGVPATRVGEDERGKRFFRELDSRGLDTNYVQVDPQRPTGTVTVTLDEAGDASYVFAADVAWDACEDSPGWRSLAESCHAVCFGTLARRCPPSRQAVESFLRAASGAIRLFDVNFRQDFYSAPIVENSLRLATAAKLNRDELTEVCGLLGLAEASGADKDAQAHALVGAFDLDWLALSQGADGTAIYAGGGKHLGKPAPIDKDDDADSVGAGDACCAGLLVGRCAAGALRKP